MNKNKFEIPIQIFKKNNNTLRMYDAMKQGVPKHLIYRMLSIGILIREERGLYRLADAEPLTNPDLANISILIPKAVICLISALYFYNLTTQIPNAVWVALPDNIRKPSIEYPPIEIVRLLPGPYSAGIEEHLLDGIKVRIYSEKKPLQIVSNSEKKLEKISP